MSESDLKKNPGTMVVRMTVKDELVPVMQEMGQRLESVQAQLESCKTELKSIGQLFLDNLALLCEFKGSNKGPPDFIEEPPLAEPCAEDQKIIEAVVHDIHRHGQIFQAIRRSLRAEAFCGDSHNADTSKVGVVR